MFTGPQIQEMTQSFQHAQLADHIHSSDTTCGGNIIAQEDAELVIVVDCSLFFHTACHAVNSDTAWLKWTSVLLIISPALPSLLQSCSSITCFSSTQSPVLPPYYLVGAVNLPVTVLRMDSLHDRPWHIHTSKHENDTHLHSEMHS